MPHVTILYAEDSAVVRCAVVELLEAEGWRVEVCVEGRAALELLEGGARYDLLLFDNVMPSVSGLELAGRARELSHRSATPLVVISASDCELEARRAGADEFLRKPEDISRIVAVVASLLDARVMSCEATACVANLRRRRMCCVRRRRVASRR